MSLAGADVMRYDHDTISITLNDTPADMFRQYMTPSTEVKPGAVRGIAANPSIASSIPVRIFDSAVCPVPLASADLRIRDGPSQTVSNSYTTEIREVTIRASDWESDGRAILNAGATEVRIDSGQYWHPVTDGMIMTENLGSAENLNLEFMLGPSSDMPYGASQTVTYLATCGRIHAFMSCRA